MSYPMPDEATVREWFGPDAYDALQESHRQMVQQATAMVIAAAVCDEVEFEYDGEHTMLVKCREVGQ